MKATLTSLSNGIVNAGFDNYGQLWFMSVNGKCLLLTKDEASSFTLHDDKLEAYGETSYPQLFCKLLYCTLLKTITYINLTILSLQMRGMTAMMTATTLL